MTDIDREALARAIRHAMVAEGLGFGGAADAVIDHLRATAHPATAGDEPLAEWQCPSCGATTRARMADKPAEPGDGPLREWHHARWFDSHPPQPDPERVARRRAHPDRDTTACLTCGEVLLAVPPTDQPSGEG